MPAKTTNKVRNAERPTETVKEFAQQGAAYGKEIFGMSKAAAAQTSEALQHSYSRVAKGGADFNVQWIDMVLANTNSTLDFARQLAGVKSPSEFLEVSTAHARKQFDAFTQQSQHLAGLAQKVTTDAVQPLQAGVKSAFNKAA